MTNVLITGGAGYIGSSLAEALIRDGYNVTIFDSLMHGNAPVLYRLDKKLSLNMSTEDVLCDDVKSLYRNRPQFMNFRFRHGDVRDAKALVALFDEVKPDVVFHFSEIVGDLPCKTDQEMTRAVNHEGTKKVVDLSIKHHAKLVWNSSSSVYGWKENPEPSTEEDGWPSKSEEPNPYCRNKLFNEAYIKEQAEKHDNFEYAVFRPATVGGIGLRTRIDLFPNMVPFAGMTQDTFKLAQPGDYRAFVGIDGLVECYRRLLHGDRKWESGIYNAGGINTTKGAFAEYVSQKTGLSIALINGYGADKRSLQISTQKLSDYLGFAPDNSIEHMVDPLIDMMREHRNIFFLENGEINTLFMNTAKPDFLKLLNG